MEGRITHPDGVQHSPDGNIAEVARAILRL
jgi:hypothetical protein